MKLTSHIATGATLTPQPVLLQIPAQKQAHRKCPYRMPDGFCAKSNRQCPAIDLEKQTVL